jgi:hypothetical protein
MTRHSATAAQQLALLRWSQAVLCKALGVTGCFICMMCPQVSSRRHLYAFKQLHSV